MQLIIAMLHIDAGCVSNGDLLETRLPGLAKRLGRHSMLQNASLANTLAVENLDSLIRKRL